MADAYPVIVLERAQLRVLLSGGFLELSAPAGLVRGSRVGVTRHTVDHPSAGEGEHLAYVRHVWRDERGRRRITISLAPEES